MSSIGNLITTILHPLEWVVATIMVAFHTVLTTLGMPAASGWTWALSIVGLVIVIRIILIPLFVKQIKASRGMQLIQPEIQKIQKKYKGKTDPASRQAMTQETMALYKESGTNPFASCLPIVLQMPIFFSLYRVLRNIALTNPKAIGPFSLTLIHQADHSTLFGARLSDKFVGAPNASTRILTVVLIVMMSGSQFFAQRQLMSKNMPAAAMDNPFAKQQKMLMYVLPLFFFITGPNFPIGVLLYWLTTNVWSVGQQFYVIRRMPAPGSQAEREYHERQARKGKTAPGGDAGTGPDAEDAAPSAGQRQQPKRAPRGKRGPRPVGPVDPAQPDGAGGESDGPQDADAGDAGGGAAPPAGPKPKPSGQGGGGKPGDSAQGPGKRPGGGAAPKNKPGNGQVNGSPDDDTGTGNGQTRPNAKSAARKRGQAPGRPARGKTN